jgi:signal transduction histidine kinase
MKSSKNLRNPGSAETEESRTELLALLEGTIDATEEGLLVVDLSRNTLLDNKRFGEIWKMPEDVLRERSDEKRVQWALDQVVDPERFLRRVDEVMRNPDVLGVDRIETKSGQILSRSSRPHRVGGVTVGVVWSVRDITAQSKFEEANRRAVRRAEILAEVSQTLSGSLDFKTTVAAIMNITVPKFADWSGLGLAEGEAGVRLVAFASPNGDQSFTNQVVNTVLNADAPRGICHAVRTGKTEFYPKIEERDLYCINDQWPIVGTRDPETLANIRKLGLCSFMVVPLRVRGRVMGAMSFARTSPDLPYSEDDLSLAEELSSRFALALDSSLLYQEALRTIQVREDFLSVASHELRTPLSPLRMQVEMAKRFAKDFLSSDPKREELVTLLDGAGLQMDRLLKLVNNLLDFSRIAAGRLALDLEWFDLGVLLDEILTRFTPLVKKAGCTLEVVRPSGGISGYWDRTRIDQVISNLLSNALKFGAGSKIEFKLEANPGEIRLLVRDYGIGIAANDSARIFERFERADGPTDYPGFGLGLFIAREIVTAHAGSISVASELGKGACFTVKLPVKARADSSAV